MAEGVEPDAAAIARPVLGMEEVEAQAAHPRAMPFLQRRRGDALVGDGDAAQPPRHAVDRVEHDPVVVAVSIALHDDAATAGETDWPQILAWYDDLVALTGDPVHQDPAAVLGRAVAVGHVHGAAAGLRETDRLREVLGGRSDE